jgi:hypothetical protein
MLGQDEHFARGAQALPLFACVGRCVGQSLSNAHTSLASRGGCGQTTPRKPHVLTCGWMRSGARIEAPEIGSERAVPHARSLSTTPITQRMRRK